MSHFNTIIGLKNHDVITLLENLETLGCPNVKILRNPDGTIPANFCELPTFADVFDWLMDKGYTIYIEPCSTFSTANHIAWWWVLNVYNIHDGYDFEKHEDVDIYGHWDECALAAITKAVELMK